MAKSAKSQKRAQSFYKPGTHNYLCRLDGAHSWNFNYLFSTQRGYL